MKTTIVFIGVVAAYAIVLSGIGFAEDDDIVTRHDKWMGKVKLAWEHNKRVKASVVNPAFPSQYQEPEQPIELKPFDGENMTLEGVLQKFPEGTVTYWMEGGPYYLADEDGRVFALISDGNDVLTDELIGLRIKITGSVRQGVEFGGPSIKSVTSYEIIHALQQDGLEEQPVDDPNRVQDWSNGMMRPPDPKGIVRLDVPHDSGNVIPTWPMPENPKFIDRRALDQQPKGIMLMDPDLPRRPVKFLGKGVLPSHRIGDLWTTHELDERKAIEEIKAAPQEAVFTGQMAGERNEVLLLQKKQ